MKKVPSLAKVGPLDVKIPTPCYTPRRRGVVNANKYGEQIRVRLSDEEKALLNYISQDLGMKRGAFIRWCAVHVADQLDRWKEQHYGDPDRPRGYRHGV